MASHRCHKCQQVIIGSGHLYEGKSYCDQCYAEIVKKLEQEEQEKNSLFEYIKKLFGIVDIPDSWIYTIDKLIASGKTIYGIRMTLYYYYEYCGNTPNPEYGLSIVKTQYDTARAYVARQKELTQINMNHQDQSKTVHVQIQTPVTYKRKPKYRIEDL